MSLPLYQYFLIFSIIAGLTVYSKRPVPLYLKLFPLFLTIKVIVDFVAVWMATHLGSNIVLYNYYNIFDFGFYLFTLREIITDRRVKKIILVSTGVFVLFSFTNLFYLQKLQQWNSMTYSVGCLMVVGYCIYYFLELFKRPISTKLNREPAFYIVSGLLFYNCCSFPFFGLNNFLANAPDLLLRNLVSILTVLNILLYLLFSIAFLCRLNINKTIRKH